MGNNCICSSDDTSCGTAIGNCSNKKCSSSCTKKAQEDAIKIEEVIDAVLKRWIDDHLHKYLREHLSSPVAHQVEETLVQAINIDVIPRLSVDVTKSASEIQETRKSI
jgi:hypothetical protein